MSPIACMTPSLLCAPVASRACLGGITNLPSLAWGLDGWLASGSCLILRMPALRAAQTTESRVGLGMLACLGTRRPADLLILESK